MGEVTLESEIQFVEFDDAWAASMAGLRLFHSGLFLIVFLLRNGLLFHSNLAPVEVSLRQFERASFSVTWPRPAQPAPDTGWIDLEQQVPAFTSEPSWKGICTR